MARPIVACALATLALVACGERTPLPSACIKARPEAVRQALADAPGAVALADGTRLSDCVALAIDDTQLQALGALLTTSASQLARRIDGPAPADGTLPRQRRRAALELGYLIGAVARGAARTGGLQGELADRLAGAGAVADTDARPELLRGLAAGRRGG